MEDAFFEIDKDELAQCQREFARGGVTACQDFLRKKADQWKTIPLNIGIIGNSGSGKSSFINTVRGMDGDDEGAAKVGVTETTTDPAAYAHPNNEQLKFWDLPGVGTPKFPQESYLEKIGFEKFDFFLIISKDRFTENDLWIAHAIDGKKKQFFFVRSNIHSNVKNDKRSHPKTHDPEILLVKIKENIRENLKDLYRESAVFLIDNHHRNLYEFNLLEQRLIQDLPSLKKAAFVLSMSTLSEDMVRKKVEILRQQIWKVALLSGTVAAVPVPGVSFLCDTGLILGQNQFYFKQLGLDEESLKETARIMSCDVNQLTQIADQARKAYLTMQGIVAYIQSVSALVASETAEQFLRWIPFAGSLIAGGISAWAMYSILNRILTKLEETALEVVRVALASSSAKIADEDSDSE